MGAAREPDQADFDLERFVNMFDEAMTSQDPRVMETLRSLMMIVAMTRPESYDSNDHKRGPLRRAFEDMNHLWKRIEQMEQELRQMHLVHQRMSREQPEWGNRSRDAYEYPYEKYSMQAAGQLASQIDQDVLAKIRAQNTVQVKAKGLLKK